jgi:hypothetical protein
MRNLSVKYKDEVKKMELVGLGHINQQTQTPTLYYAIEKINTKIFIELFTEASTYELFSQKIFSRN